MLTNLCTKMNKKKKKKGFTLVELIIVIAIIAILAAIAIPKFGAVRQRANYNADIANGKTIQSAITTLIAENRIGLPVAAASPMTIVLDSTATGTLGTPTTAAILAPAIAATVIDYLQDTPDPAFGVQTHFEATIATDGTVVIYAGAPTTNQVCPDQTGDHLASLLP